MAELVTINLRHVARGLGISLRQVEAVVELLDEGNTVPFITRYRKDQTGGLDEEQVRQVQARLIKTRLLAERKQTILRSIEAQGKLTEKLAKQIQAAGTTKRLEDLYLPFKPKKQTLATTARSRGLELLANEILTAAVGAEALDMRAADFASTDRHVPTAADALLGAGHILAEQFSENAELRHRLREILQRSGRLVSSQIGGEGKGEKEEKTPTASAEEKSPAGQSTPASAPVQPEMAEAAAPNPEVQEPAAVPTDTVEASDIQVNPGEASGTQDSPQVSGGETSDTPAPDVGSGQGGGSVEESPGSEESPAEGETVPAAAVEPVQESVAPATIEAEPPAIVESNIPSEAPAIAAGESPATQSPTTAPVATVVQSTKTRSKPTKSQLKREKKDQKKKKAEQRKLKAFSDYYIYSEEIKKIPPHRVLAINRGERAKVLRVKVDSDLEAMYQVLDELCVPPGHPHADFLRGCARDALTRLILPSLEREVRRELTERAEAHAVGVFARNLRNLLLQPPVRDRRVLAVDPGFKSGCKLVALDQFGNVLGHEVIYLVGKPERKQEARRQVVGLVQKYQLTAITVGNGTACREAEDFFASILAEELKDQGVCYVIVNEAGASVYSTSRIGREEFPTYDASLRGAISIGRRLQDPLSELVKIDPANIGVGLYQHDVKAKHLRESLDEVVESCVNYVGVDVNTASPALLRYVSGLNQLTARRVYEFRLEHGPLRSRQQLREIPGFGEATFVQSAGFLKIAPGENPLDATWIHPESYAIASHVMEKLGASWADLSTKETAAALSERIAKLDMTALAAELQVGAMLLKDILAQLARPGRDPREDLPAPIFKQGIVKLEDLTPGMELTGTVLNVVDFGAFVDIGMHDSGLVHVSQLADKFVRDPHEVIAVGDIVKVWVMEVDKQRRRVSLTMIPPGHERTPSSRHGRPSGHPQGEGQARPAGSGRPEGQGRPQGQGQGQRSQDRPAGGPPRHGDRPRFDRRPPQGRGGSRQGSSQPPRPAPKPKPLKPITDEMKAGKSPMRSFGDLLQFYDLHKEEPAQGDQRRPGKGDRKGKGGPAGGKPQTPGAKPGIPEAQSGQTPQAPTDQGTTPSEAASQPPALPPEIKAPAVANEPPAASPDPSTQPASQEASPAGHEPATGEESS